MEGSALKDIVYEWNEVGTSATVENLPAGLTYNISGNKLTISGTPTAGGTFKITISGDKEAGVKDVTTTGLVKIVTPFRVLTGDWYHFQDAWDALPEDLQGVIELVAGSSNATTFAPDKTETDGSVPGGCTAGGIDMGKNNGGIRWNLANGVLQLKVNLHFTGDRTYKINWTLANGQSKSFTTEKMKKTTLIGWDLIEVAGISEADAKQIRAIELLNTATGGGARVYDMYVRVPDPTATSISNVNANFNENAKTRKYISNGRIVIVKNGIRYNTLGQKM
jgi:hypothetical protein